MLFGFLVFLFVVVCIFLCLLILIQSDKGGGISGAIGGGLGGASSLLGTQDTANILTRGTQIFAGAFLVLCIILSFAFGRQGHIDQKSLLQQRAQKQQTYSPSSVLSNKGLPIQGAQKAMPATGSGAANQQSLPIAPSQTEK